MQNYALLVSLCDITCICCVKIKMVYRRYRFPILVIDLYCRVHVFVDR